MNETKRAVKGSIKKWQKIVDGKAIDGSSSDCPLCEEFFSDDCQRCPIADITGQIYCNNTPYMDYTRERDEDKMKKLAKKELWFLRSILYHRWCREETQDLGATKDTQPE